MGFYDILQGIVMGFSWDFDGFFMALLGFRWLTLRSPSLNSAMDGYGFIMVVRVSDKHKLGVPQLSSMLLDGSFSNSCWSTSSIIYIYII